MTTTRRSSGSDDNPLPAYDDLDAADRAHVRAAWDDAIDTALQRINLLEEFRAAGRAWSELDKEGRVVRRS